MSKSSWITAALDGSVSDDKIKLLLFAGVSIASVARRLGHASMTTTQKTYLHIIQELENKDVDLIMLTLILLLKIFPKVVIWILRH